MPRSAQCVASGFGTWLLFMWGKNRNAFQKKTFAIEKVIIFCFVSFFSAIEYEVGTPSR